MKTVEIAFQEFIDGIHTASSERDFKSVADRTAQQLGFRWFAYLGFTDTTPVLISSYPRKWAAHYFAESYERVDPVVEISRRERNVFRWDGSERSSIMGKAQRRLFDDASTFGIRRGVTVPIIAGFGRFAAFTFASDEQSPALDRQLAAATDLIQLIGLNYHAHVEAKIVAAPANVEVQALSQRELECLAWSARGKTMDETAAILGVKPRTVLFHLENARRRLNANTLAHAVAIAARKNMLP